MKRVRAIVLLLAIVNNPFEVNANVLLMLGVGDGVSGGGGTACSTLSLNACLSTGMIL